MAASEPHTSDGELQLTFIDVQSRGKWMIPAYKCVLFGSFGASMYMMSRLVLVSLPLL
jgi:hypothetical protein